MLLHDGTASGSSSNQTGKQTCPRRGGGRRRDLFPPRGGASTLITKQGALQDHLKCCRCSACQQPLSHWSASVSQRSCFAASNTPPGTRVNLPPLLLVSEAAARGCARPSFPRRRPRTSIAPAPSCSTLRCVRAAHPSQTQPPATSLCKRHQAVQPPPPPLPALWPPQRARTSRTACKECHAAQPLQIACNPTVPESGLPRAARRYAHLLHTLRG